MSPSSYSCFLLSTICGLPCYDPYVHRVYQRCVWSLNTSISLPSLMHVNTVHLSLTLSLADSDSAPTALSLVPTWLTAPKCPLIGCHRPSALPLAGCRKKVHALRRAVEELTFPPSHFLLTCRLLPSFPCCRVDEDQQRVSCAAPPLLVKRLLEELKQKRAQLKAERVRRRRLVRKGPRKGKRGELHLKCRWCHIVFSVHSVLPWVT